MEQREKIHFIPLEFHFSVFWADVVSIGESQMDRVRVQSLSRGKIDQSSLQVGLPALVLKKIISKDYFYSGDVLFCKLIQEL